MSAHRTRLAMLALCLTLLSPPLADAAAPPRPRTDRYGDPLPPGAVARLGTVRLRRLGCIRQPAFHPDGRTVATVGSDGVYLWDLRTGRLARAFRARPARDMYHCCFAVAPDGKTLAAGVYDGLSDPALYLWDVASGKEQRRLAWRSESRPEAVAVSPDGKVLACGDSGGVVRLWDAGAGRLLRAIAGPKWDIESVAFSADGKALATLDRVNNVRLLEVATGKVRHQFVPDRTSSLVLSPDARFVGTPDHEDAVWLWDVATGKGRRVAGESASRLAFSPDGKRLAMTGSTRGALRIWDAGRGRLVRSLKAPALQWPAPTWLALSPDARTVAVSEHHHMLRLLDAATGRERVSSRGHAYPLRGMGYGTGGKVLTSVDDRGQVFRWEAATGRVLARWRSWDMALARGVRFSPDGALVAHPGPSGGVVLRDVVTGEVARPLGGYKGRVYDLAFSPDGKTLASAGADATVRVWDVAAGKLLRAIDVEKLRAIDTGKFAQEVHWLAFSPDGRTLAAGERAERLHLWDAATGRHRGSIEADPAKGEAGSFPDDGWDASFTPDGRAVVACQYGRCQVWDLVARAEVSRLSARGTDLPLPAALSPDGRLLAKFEGHGVLRLWEVASARPVFRFEGEHTWVLFAPGGRTVATASGEDGSILVWDVRRLLGGGGRNAPLARGEVSRLWEELAQPDAGRAYRAVWRLADSPGESVPFLRPRLRPAPRADARRLARLVAELDDDSFAVREAATKELGGLAESAEPALRRAAERHATPEVRRRVRRLLQELAKKRRAGEDLRPRRALAALEYSGGPAARQLLAELATGAPEAGLTQEARAALRRLAGRPPAKP